MERFCGVLIEHFGGDFPLWLAPEQVRLVPVSDKTLDYGQDLLARLKAAGVRATLDEHNDKLGAKIRRAEIEKVPYTLVLGAKEAEARRSASAAAPGATRARCRPISSSSVWPRKSAPAPCRKRNKANRYIPLRRVRSGPGPGVPGRGWGAGRWPP